MISRILSKGSIIFKDGSYQAINSRGQWVCTGKDMEACKGSLIAFVRKMIGVKVTVDFEDVTAIKSNYVILMSKI